MSEKSVKNKKYYAHSAEGKTVEGWHRLEDHLKKVAEMARRFADNFNAGDWGYLSVLTHGSELTLRGFKYVS